MHTLKYFRASASCRKYITRVIKASVSLTGQRVPTMESRVHAAPSIDRYAATKCDRGMRCILRLNHALRW
jgi:hypothetical protein